MSPVRQAISCSVRVLPSGSASRAYLTPPPTSSTAADLNAAADQLSAGLHNVGHHQMHALDRAGCHLVVGRQSGAHADRARRTCWGQLHDPHARRRLRVDVFNKTEPFNIERFRAVNIGDWNRTARASSASGLLWLEAVRPRLLVVSLDAGRRRNSSLPVWTYGLSWLQPVHAPVSSARRFLSPRHSRTRARRARAVGSDERLNPPGSAAAARAVAGVAS